MDDKWYVSLGDGTFVEMDELPFVFFARKDAITIIDTHLGGVAPDCKQGEEAGIYDTHIHIKDLVLESHWADHTDVNKETLPHE